MSNPSELIDFREKIEELNSSKYTVNDFKQKLGERIGVDPDDLTSVTPNTEALFGHIFAGEDPIECQIVEYGCCLQHGR